MAIIKIRSLKENILLSNIRTTINLLLPLFVFPYIGMFVYIIILIIEREKNTQYIIRKIRNGIQHDNM
jgi:hypothetical protein